MKPRALALLLSLVVLGSGCEKVRSLAGMAEKNSVATGQPAASRQSGAAKKPPAAKPPLPFPKEQAEAILDQQEKISTETRDAFLARQLSKSEEDDLYFEPPADETWSKLTPERR
ncbi:MAG: hypothetical protein HYT87_12155 [Nitrospirae bacterium]|nr:hypothetical protein [Nitrospirota bacterium]